MFVCFTVDQRNVRILPVVLLHDSLSLLGRVSCVVVWLFGAIQFPNLVLGLFFVRLHVN